MNLLYIDPGTGSMLFSIVIGAAATLFFLGKAAILKLKLLFSGKNKDTLKADSSYKPYVIYCEGKQYWGVFKTILDEFEKRNIELNYLTSVKDDLVFSENYKFIKAEYIGDGNTAFARLNLLSAGIVLMTTPGLNVYQLKRSKNVKKYVHIFHSTTDATLYRLFGIDYFDTILLTGDYQIENIRLLEKQRNLPAKELVTVGCTYLDKSLEEIKALEKENEHQFTVLLSPSWGPSALLTKYGEKLIDPLVKTGWRIIIRPHPQSKKSENEMLSNLEDKYKNTSNIEWDYNSKNIISMSKADIMISDFSGIIFDYTFLFNKPVIYVSSDMDLRPYDAYDTNKELWQFQVLKQFGIELNEDDFPRIQEVIKNASDSIELENARKNAKETAWMNIGQSGKLTADYMINTETKQE